MIVGLLAAVLALQAADLATVGAVGAELERAFGLDHLELALLAAIASLLAAATTLPFGALADRLPRVRLLTAVVALWGVATTIAGLAGSFGVLLGSRLFLGVTVAAAGPLLASLIGDLFPASERARIYGYILTGELAGSGFGFLVSGNVAGFLSWRWSFWVLALPAWALAWLIHRHLREPERGAQVAGAAGAVIGVLLGGRLADRLLRHGRLDARILVAAVAITAAAALALPPFLGNWPLLLAMPLFIVATAFLTAGNPPLDAARLDVVPSGLWGRAESIRTVLRSLAIASAPLLVGLFADLLGDEGGEGLRLTFTLMLLPLGASGLVLLWARRSYPTDVATALAAEG